MKRLHIPRWLARILNLSARHRYYPLVVAFIAFVSTTTFTFPFAIVLIPADLVVSHYPELIETDTWRFAIDWMENYGLFALIIIAGSPMPQTPALFFYSLADPSAFGVLVAVGIGKIVKYVFLAWATYRYPFPTLIRY